MHVAEITLKDASITTPIIIQVRHDAYSNMVEICQERMTSNSSLFTCKDGKVLVDCSKQIDNIDVFKEVSIRVYQAGLGLMNRIEQCHIGIINIIAQCTRKLLAEIIC
jgi:hypothetical protein